ncbi:MAG: T9SS type A sorting domain-containing protein, partial [Bacteroidota bacterium]
SGSAAKSALMSRTANGQYLCVTGYVDTVGDPNVTTSAATVTPREVGIVDYNGNINTTTIIIDSYSGAKIRGVASVDGTHFWTSGNSGSIRYMPLGCTGNTIQITTNPTNSNALGIFNGQLYCTADHVPVGLDSVGRGLPTASTGGSAVALHANTNPTSGFEFQWLVLSPGDTVVYIANQVSGGLAKYSWRNDSLILCGNIAGTYIGLTGTVNCAGIVELFYDNSASTSNPVFRFIDSSGYLGTMHTSSGNPSTIVAGSTIAFNKGIAFAPYIDITVTSTQNIVAGSYNNIIINNGGVATLTGNIKMVGTLTINNGGTLICNGYNVLGNSDFQNAFVLNSGGTLKIGSAAGITSSAASGNVQTCARYFSTGGNYVYNGNVNQVTGNALPYSVSSLTIANTGSSNNNTVTLTAGVTTTNNLTISNGILDVSINNYAINTGGNFYNNSSFICRTGTLTFMGSGAQNFLPGSSNYYNVNISNSGSNTASLLSDLNISNNFNITSGSFDVSSSNYAINISGNFTNNSTFTSRSGTVNFNGAASQSFTPGSSNYYNVIISNSGNGTLTLAGNLTCTHDISISSGTLDVSSSNYSITVAGSFYNNSGFNAEYGPLTFNGTNSENFLPGNSSYHAIVINNIGNNTVILQSNLTLNNNLTITSGTLDVSTSNYSITTGGNFINNSTFNAHTGAVTFNGSSSANFNPGSSAFYNVNVNNSGLGSVTLLNSLNILNDLTITTGIFDISTNNYSINISGNLYNYGAFNSHNGTITFNGGSSQAIYGGSSNFYNILIQGWGSQIVNLMSNLTMTGTLTIDFGILDANSGNYNIAVGGDFINNAQFNAEGGILSVAGNFYDESYFNSQSGTVVLNGNNMQYLDDLNVDFFNIVTINNTNGGVYLIDPFFIGTTLNCNNGYLLLNGMSLYIANSSPSAVNRTNGFVVSENYNTIGTSPDVQVDNTNLSFIQWNIGTSSGIFTFPFGNYLGQYIPFAIQNSNSNDLGIVSAATWNAPYNVSNTNTNGPLPQTVTNINHLNIDNSDNTVKRFWQLSKSGTGILTAMTFCCANTEALNDAGNAPIVNLLAQRWNGSIWQFPASSGSPIITIPSGAASATGYNIPELSPWALTGNSVTLPIELLGFEAVYKSNLKLVRLDWATASEINNQFFTLQRTSDGENFQDIGKVDGAGNSNSIRAYNFDDLNPLEGQSYYRLKQTDFDGNFTYTNLRSVYIGTDDFVSLFPNPTNDFAILKLNTKAIEYITVQITDSRGGLVSSNDLMTKTGENKYEISTNKLSPGFYFIKVISSTDTKVQKLFVNH